MGDIGVLAVILKKCNMGVTIHFEGQLRSANDFEKVVQISCDFAQLNKMDYNVFEEQDKLLQRVKDQEDWDYVGLTRGVKIQPNPNSDPLWIEFDKDFYIQEYCKTQFVDKRIHIKIIELLQSIEPYFNHLIVVDEGEYWDSGNPKLLQQHLDNCFNAIEDAKKENPKLSGPFRVTGDRIVDLMEND
jgi:hypothetical protein